MIQFFSIIWLSGKDLWHDKRMTFCLVLTVASIALPLLLFFGLKNGAMEVLRKRMLNDPVYMEVMPEGTATYDTDWFANWRANPRVGFVMPRTRELGVSAKFKLTDRAGAEVRADMLPTLDGDWLLQSYQTGIPGLDQCVLSASMAKTLGITAPGTSITVFVDRQRKGGGTEVVERALTVSGILPNEAGSLQLVYLPLAQLELMENYRDGRAVPEFGWAGEPVAVPPVFHAVHVYSPKILDPLKIPLIQQRSGFVRVETVTMPGTPYPSSALANIPEGMGVYRLQTGPTPADARKMNELRNILRGEDATVVPLGEKSPQDSEIRALFPGTASIAVPVRATALWADPPQEVASLMPSWAELSVEPALMLARPVLAARFADNKVNVEFRAGDAGNSIVLPVRIIPSESAPEDAVMVSPGFIGVLNQMHDRRLLVSMEAGGEPVVLPGRRDYPRFRMYAKNLEQVAPLAEELEAAGIRVSTRAAEIARVQKMDQYLTLLFGVIAAGSALGGGVCLLSSLYANVERKRRELAVLRLLGTHGIALSAFPLTGGVVVAVLGLGFALTCFHMVGLFINTVCGDFILPGEKVCVLSAAQQVSAMALGLLAAIAAGLAAAVRLQGIEPAECLRDE